VNTVTNTTVELESVITCTLPYQYYLWW